MGSAFLTVKQNTTRLHGKAKLESAMRTHQTSMRQLIEYDLGMWYFVKCLCVYVTKGLGDTKIVSTHRVAYDGSAIGISGYMHTESKHL